MIYFLAQKHLCGIEPYLLKPWRQSDTPGITIVAFEDLFASRELPAGTWIFMGVRQMTPAGRRLAEGLWQTLHDAGQKVLNHPAGLESRHQFLETMHHAGINEFRSWRPGELDGDIRYPVFVRLAEEHTGSVSPLLNSRRELDSFIRWQRLRGYKLSELLVVEFCDTANDAGEYRKYSAQFVDGQISAQFAHVDTDWVVKHHGSMFVDHWADEEHEYISSNPRTDEISRVFELAKVDFGRIDYGLLDGRMQVWEINTNPSIGGARPGSNVKQTPKAIRELQFPGRRIFYQRFQSMLESIDTPHDPDVKIEFCCDESDLRQWRREVSAVQRLRRRRVMLRRLTESRPVERALDAAKYVLGVSSK